jgi:hypothetical protein
MNFFEKEISMTEKLFKLKKTSAALFAAIFFFGASSASALDAAKDRRGLFWGMGMGGNGSLSIPGPDVGGGFNFDIQLGAGATKNLTLSLDVDVIGVYLESQQNIIFCPGPELNYFFGETGLFIRVGLAAALSLVQEDETDSFGNTTDNGVEFGAGFQAGGGFGWEFFANTNLALGIAVEVDYMLRNVNDFVMFGFMFNMKYY